MYFKYTEHTTSYKHIKQSDKAENLLKKKILKLLIVNIYNFNDLQ